MQARLRSKLRGSGGGAVAVVGGVRWVDDAQERAALQDATDDLAAALRTARDRLRIASAGSSARTHLTVSDVVATARACQ